MPKAKEVLMFTNSKNPQMLAMRARLQTLQSVHLFPMRVYEMVPVNAPFYSKYDVRSAPVLVLLDENEKEVVRVFGSQSTTALQVLFKNWKLIK